MNYIVGHWRGQQGLARSALLNGLLVYIVLVVVFSLLDTFTETLALTFGGLAVLLVWLIWASVGIFRCGARNAMDPNKQVWSRIGGVIVIFAMILVAYFSVVDLGRLGFITFLH